MSQGRHRRKTVKAMTSFGKVPHRHNFHHQFSFLMFKQPFACIQRDLSTVIPDIRPHYVWYAMRRDGLLSELYTRD